MYPWGKGGAHEMSQNFTHSAMALFTLEGLTSFKESAEWQTTSKILSEVNEIRDIHFKSPTRGSLLRLKAVSAKLADLAQVVASIQDLWKPSVHLFVISVEVMIIMVLSLKYPELTSIHMRTRTIFVSP